MLPRSLLIPPGIPDFPDRQRFLAPGPCVLEGRAWSGYGPVTRVEVSVDGGRELGGRGARRADGEFGWRRWTYAWDDAEPGDYELCSRATDGAGNVQPTDPEWNYGGYVNNAVQRVPSRRLGDGRLVLVQVLQPVPQAA